MSQPNKRTFGPATEIDDKAKIAFLSAVCLPLFVVRLWSPDTFLDYKLESLTDGEPTGEFTFVQLKGQHQTKISNGLLSYPFGTKQLRYYGEKLREPVFLVVVDTQTGVGYFLFVQAWLDTHAGDKALNQNTITLTIPTSNLLIDKALFRLQVHEALKYMRRKYSGSVQDAMVSEINAYQKIDPRFNVRLRTDGLKTHVQFTAKEPVDLALTVNSPTDATSQEKLQKLLKFGRPAKFQDAEIKLTGSPLFNQLQWNSKAANLAISPSRATACDFIIYNKQGGLLMSCAGQTTPGSEGLTFSFTGESPQIPLRLTTEVPRKIMEEGGGTTCQIGWDFTEWINVPVRLLKFFNAIMELSTHLVSQDGLKTEIRINGDSVALSEIVAVPPTDAMLCTHLILDCIAKLRAISAASRTEIQVPAFTQFTPETIEEIHKAHDLFITGEHVIRAEQVIIKADYRLLPGEPPPPESVDSDYSPLTISSGPQIFSLLGKELPLGPLTHILERAKKRITSEHKTAESPELHTSVPVEFFSEPGSVLRIIRNEHPKANEL